MGVLCWRRWRLVLAAGVLLSGVPHAAQTPAPRLHIVIVVDGLTPDMVTARQMPRLDRLAGRGVEFTAHHAVFPTVTRVNAATFVTGVLPVRHGLLGNSIYIPSVDPVKAIDTSDHEALLRVAARDRSLVAAPTLGQILARGGKRLLVVSSGSPGSALLLSPTADAGVILHTEFARPDEWRAKSVAVLGPTPTAQVPNAARNRYATDLLLRIGLPEVRPDVVFVWYSDPDTTAHARGLDDPATGQSLGLVDAEIGRIEDWLRDQGRLETTNLLVTSDHGFSTHTGGFDLPAIVKPFIRTLPDGTPDIVTAGGAVHFRGAPDDARVAAVVEALQKQPAVGAIFTRGKAPGDLAGHVMGTLSFDVIGWAHRRAGQILVSAAWTGGTAPGTGGSTTAAGRAGHGSTSPFEVRNTLVAAGPDFREAFESPTATGTVDITPTLLHLTGLGQQGGRLDGRVIREGLRSWKGALPKRTAGGTVVPSRDGTYTVEAHVTTVDGVRYFDSATARRRPAPPP
jgi:hypothetical protein